MNSIDIHRVDKPKGNKAVIPNQFKDAKLFECLLEYLILLAAIQLEWLWEQSCI